MNGYTNTGCRIEVDMTMTGLAVNEAITLQLPVGESIEGKIASVESDHIEVDIGEPKLVRVFWDLHDCPDAVCGFRWSEAHEDGGLTVRECALPITHRKDDPTTPHEWEVADAHAE